jgi:hypothetical protein
VFSRLFGGLGEGPSWEEARPLQDYMFHEMVRSAAERGLPIQIHTGLQEGNGNILGNSNPLLLTNLFLEYHRDDLELSFSLWFPDSTIFHDFLGHVCRIRIPSFLTS